MKINIKLKALLDLAEKVLGKASGKKTDKAILDKVVGGFTKSLKGDKEFFEISSSEFKSYANRAYINKILKPVKAEAKARASKTNNRLTSELIEEVKKHGEESYAKKAKIKSSQAKKEVESLVNGSENMTYEEIKDELVKAHEHIIYKEKLSKLMVENEPFMSEKELKDSVVKSMKLKPNKSGEIKYKGKLIDDYSVPELVDALHGQYLKRVTRKAYIDVVDRRMKAFKPLITHYKISPVMAGISNIYGKVDLLYRVAKDNDFKHVSNTTKGLFNYLEQAERFESQARQFGSGMIEHFKQFDEKAQRNIVSYIENAKKFERVPYGSETGLNTTIAVDKELASKLGMSQAEIETANILINGNRALLNAVKDLEHSKYDITQSLPSFDDFISHAKDIDFKQSHWLNRGESNVVGDAGNNYWHRVPNEIGEARIKKSKLHNSYTTSNPSFMKGRVDEKFQLTPEERVSPLEELEHYITEYQTKLARKFGEKHLQNVAASMSIDYIDGIVIHNRKITAEVEGNFRTLFDSVKKNFDDLYSRPIALPNDTIGGQIRNITYNIADVNTTAALLSPIFSGMNALQGITNSVPFHGFGNIVAGYKDFAKYSAQAASSGKIKAKSGLIDFLANAKWIEQGTKAIIDGNASPLEKRVLNDYFYSYKPDILMNNLMSINSIVRTILNVGASMFKLSDVFARGAVLLGTARQADRKLAQFRVKGITRDSIPYITKELHLNEFKNLEKESLINTLLSGDIDRFISEYSARSVNAELFNYSKYGSPSILLAAKKHQGLARALRFMSWTPHYISYLEGVKRSLDAGDKEPLKKLAVTSFAWLGAWGTLASQSDDDSYIHSIATYGIGRTPFFSPAMSAMSLGSRNLGGMMQPAIADMVIIPAYIFNKGLNATIGKTPFDYTLQSLENSVKYQPVVNIIRKTTGFFDE